MGSYFISGPSPAHPTPRIPLSIGGRITNDGQPFPKTSLHGFDIREDGAQTPGLSIRASIVP
jgi:hypothetical protein